MQEMWCDLDKEVEELKIQRKRWVIIRNEDEIFCGLARQFTFKPIDNIGDTSIKTYSSKAKAEAGFRNSHCRGILMKNWKAVEVTETIESKLDIDAQVKILKELSDLSSEAFYGG